MSGPARDFGDGTAGAAGSEEIARGPLAWFAANSVAANLLMALILFGGFITISSVRKEVFPELASDLITVSVVYLGAAPEEVEEAVNTRIEERVQDLEAVKRVRSTAAEGVGTVTLELLPGYDPSQALDEVKARIDAIDTFPEETEKPVIQEVVVRSRVLSVAISGPADELALKRLGERMRDEISALPGVTQVELVASRPYEISIEVSERALRRNGLSFDQVAAAVRRSSLDLPGGSVKTEGGEILLRTEGQAYFGEEFESLVLLSRPDGSRLLLGDVARVVDGFADTEQAARFDGERSVLVQIYRVGEQDSIEIAGTVKAYLEEARARLPEGVHATVWQDETSILESRLDTLIRNGRSGLLLVLIVLALFLRLGLAGWVALGIPISFMGGFWLMPTLGVSINVISLFGFIVVLGIVVDDAIVVGENIYRHHQMGKEGLRAAVDGVREVSKPVIFAILTSVAAFAPLTMVPGNIGKVMRVVPLIVIPTLLFSLLESLLVLPAHLSHLRHEKKKVSRARALWQRLQSGFSRKLEHFVEHAYGPGLEVALRWRYVSLAAAVAALLLTAGLVAGGHVRFSFFPPIEADRVAAFLAMPQGTPREVTAQALAKIETSAEELGRQLAAEGEAGAFRHVLTSIGEQPFRGAQTQRAGNPGLSYSGAHLGEITVELSEPEGREVSATEVARRWRELTGGIPDAVELTFTSALFSTGDAIDIQLAGPDLQALRTAAGELKEALRSYPGVIDIADSFRAGKQEVKVDITPEGEALGLTLGDLGRQVRQGFYGEEAQRIQRGRDDVRVMVRYPEEERRSLGDLERMRIRTPDGGEVPFSVAGEVELGRGFASIERVDRKRTVRVTADVDLELATANEILADVRARVLPRLLADYPGLAYSLEGEQQEQRETLGGLVRGFSLALFLIYALLAVPFRSYFQPLIVMSAIPFGFIGAILGHLLMGQNLTILSGFGLVALTGVVVNDSLILVDFVNRAYRSGEPLLQAIREAGKVRFRPILLTSLTTFVGLSPLLLETSVQAQFLIPMAISLAFGVLFATLITLGLVPVTYHILEDIKSSFARLLGRGEAATPQEA